MRASPSTCICRLASTSRQASPSALSTTALRSTAPSVSASQPLFSSKSNSKSWIPYSREASSKAGNSSGTNAASTSSSSSTLEGDDLAAGPSSGSTTTATLGSQADLASDGPDKARFEQWLKSDEGKKYKRPTVGRTNWIGRTPFPLNPSFRPPTPISHRQKERIYRDFIESMKKDVGNGDGTTAAAKSETYHVRQISLKHGLSLDRVRAIVRLKALEYNTAAAGTELQMKYLNGMESALGVSHGDNEPIRLQEALDVQQETEALYKVGRKSHWILVDEENPSDLAKEAEELDKIARRDEKKSQQRSGEQIPRDVRDGVRSRSRVPANPNSYRKDKRPELEFVDVASHKKDLHKFGHRSRG